MEVIARRKEGLNGVYRFATVLGVIVFALGLLSFGVGLEIFNVIRAVGFIAMAIMIVVISERIRKRYNQTPEEIIVYDGTYLICPDGWFSLSELNNVTCDHARGGKSYMRYKWGTIELYINGVKHSYQFVADVEEVQKRLMELRLQQGV